MKAWDDDNYSDEENAEEVNLLVSLADAVDNSKFEELKQKCRQLEAWFGDGGVSAEMLFDAYFEFLCYSLAMYESSSDRYAQEASKARRLKAFIDYPAYLTRVKKSFDPSKAKISRMRFEALLNRVDALISRNIRGD